jgi:hypothetical protein
MISLWTDANIERLKTLFFENKSMAEISALIPGSTRNGVIGKLHRLNLYNEARPTKKRKPHKSSPPPSTPPATGGFSFASLEPGMCRWPLGGLYCGMPIAGVRKPYCADHAAKAKRHD